MKKLLPITLVFGLFLAPLWAGALAAGEPLGSPPPVSQPIVREGDFALELSEALGLGRASNEVEAESKLASRGIAPGTGWIADYPMTPVVVDDLRQAVVNSAESGRLSLSASEATEAFDQLTTELGLAVTSGYGGATAPYDDEEPPPPEESPYLDEDVIVNHYYSAGPPIVTYYAPPWDYYYLYDWVPYPFAFAGFGFGGFFVLHDFHRDHDHYHHGRHFRKVVSNHRFDGRRFVRVNPRQHLQGRNQRRGVSDSQLSRNRRGRLPQSGNAAASLVDRDRRIARNDNPGRNIAAPRAEGSRRDLLQNRNVPPQRSADLREDRARSVRRSPLIERNPGSRANGADPRLRSRRSSEFNAPRQLQRQRDMRALRSAPRFERQGSPRTGNAFRNGAGRESIRSFNNGGGGARGGFSGNRGGR